MMLWPCDTSGAAQSGAELPVLPARIEFAIETGPPWIPPVPPSAEFPTTVLLTIATLSPGLKIAPPSFGPGPVTWLPVIVEFTTTKSPPLTIAPPLCDGPEFSTVLP